MSQPNSAPSASVAEPKEEAPVDGAGVRAPRSGKRPGLTALVLAVAMLAVVVLVRLIVGIPKVSQGYFDAVANSADRPIGWLLLGVLMLLSIVPIAAAVVFGHRGLSRAKAEGTSAAKAGIALGIGYMLVILWGVRIISAITNAGQHNGGFKMFVEYVGLWA